MSLSWSVHFCHDDDGGAASSALPELEDYEAAGVAAMVTAVKLRRGVKITMSKKAKSSRS
jgi:hypothetical protein